MKPAEQKFDLERGGIGRTWRAAMIYALVPAGRAARGGGPGWGICLRLWCWHRCGGWLCRWALRFERPAIALYAFLARSVCFGIAGKHRPGV